MASFNASFSRSVSNNVLTLVDTSNYGLGNSDPVRYKDDFYIRQFIIRDINNTVVATLPLGADGVTATYNIANILSLQPVYLEITLQLTGFGGTHQTTAPYYLPIILP